MTKRPRRNHAAGFKAMDFLGELKPDEDVIDALEDCSNRQAVYILNKIAQNNDATLAGRAENAIEKIRQRVASA